MQKPSGTRVFARYLLLQLPGWAAGALVLGGAAYAGFLSDTVAALLLAGYVAFEIALFPVVRVGYEPGPPDGAHALLGARAVVTRALEPAGTVRVGAELWGARVQHAEAPVPVGAFVRVRRVERLTLIVEPERERDEDIERAAAEPVA